MISKIKRFFKAKEIERPEAVEFIEVELKIPINTQKGKYKKGKEANLAMELFEILLNTETIYNKKRELLGYTNLKLNKTVVITDKFPIAFSKKLNKTFTIEYRGRTKKYEYQGRTKKYSEIIFKPINFKRKKISMYSIPVLYEDLPILCYASNDIEEYLGFNASETQFNPIFIKGKPAIEVFDRLVCMKYKIEDMIKYKKGWEDFSSKIFSLSIESYYKRVKENKKRTKMEITKKEEEIRVKWLKEVKKILEN